MGVYITLMVVTLLMAIFINNQDYVGRYQDFRWNTKQKFGEINSFPGGRLTGQGTKSRQQMLNFVLAAAIFCLLAGVSACRIAVGNDYWVYRDNFNLIMQGRYVSYEWGFRLSVWLIQSLFGYDNYLPVFGVFSVLTAFFFVKALYGQAQWFASSLFLLLAGGYYFNSLNSVRYYFALAVALYAMQYVIRKEYGKFILWVCGAACFHKSVLVVIPLYIMARWLAERKIKKGYYVIAALLAASFVVFQNFYRQIIFFFYPFYENSMYDTGELSYTNIAKCAATVILCLLFYKDGIKDNIPNRFYLFLNWGGLLLYTCGSFIPEISRIGYYLIVSQIFLIPGVLIRIPNKRVKLFFTAAAAVGFAGYFALYLRSAYDTSIRVLPYLNWIFN